MKNYEVIYEVTDYRCITIEAESPTAALKRATDIVDGNDEELGAGDFGYCDDPEWHSPMVYDGEKPVHSGVNVLSLYEKAKRIEVQQLKDAVEKFGGEVHFGEDYAGEDGTGDYCPIVMCNFGGYDPHPADVKILAVKYKDGELAILGRETDMYEEERLMVEPQDIAYGHIEFITSAVLSALN